MSSILRHQIRNTHGNWKWQWKKLWFGSQSSTQQQSTNDFLLFGLGSTEENGTGHQTSENKGECRSEFHFFVQKWMFLLNKKNYKNFQKLVLYLVSCLIKRLLRFDDFRTVASSLYIRFWARTINTKKKRLGYTYHKTYSKKHFNDWLDKISTLVQYECPGSLVTTTVLLFHSHFQH